MVVADLKAARRARRLTQAEAAGRLGVSQSYLAMLERGTRRLTPALARRAAKLYGLRPPTDRATALHRPTDRLAHDVAALGYPGFAYLKSRDRRRKKPGEVLLAALARADLESRLVEALPWVLLKYGAPDLPWLVREAKLRDLQNRLGFVVTLARQAAERAAHGRRVRELRALENALEPSRLAREDTLCRASMPHAERRWLAEHRPADATRWNLLTDWTVEALRYAA